MEVALIEVSLYVQNHSNNKVSILIQQKQSNLEVKETTGLSLHYLLSGV